jgi:hypothetical protein
LQICFGSLFPGEPAGEWFCLNSALNMKSKQDIRRHDRAVFAKGEGESSASTPAFL